MHRPSPTPRLRLLPVAAAALLLAGVPPGAARTHKPPLHARQ